MASAKYFDRYGIGWNAHKYADPFDVELECIRRGGKFTSCGVEVGNGLFFHYKQAMSIIWPEDDWHRWANDILREILNFKYLGIVGPGNSSKTYMTSKFGLVDYWAFPDETLSIVSSTDLRGLELRVWGTIKDLFNRGNDYREANGHDALPGVVLESLHTITTDSIDEHDKGKKARVLKKGIICIPCLANGKYVGLGKYVGAKQVRTRLFSDEAQFMGPSFLDALSNLGQSPGFKFVGLGNAVDQLDCLGRICEPREGWERHPEPEKTTVWETKWPNGGCLNLVGTDSPNFDYPETEPVKFHYMVNRIGISEVEAFWGKDSLEYWSQCKGVFKSGLLKNRFWLPDFCKQHHAHDLATWESPDRIKLASLDAAYSGTGGDRCVFRWGEYGIAHDGKEILRVERPEIVPVSIRSEMSAEDQIAIWCQKRLVELGIPSDRLFYDATGRGSLGASFAKLMGTTPPSPIEFGGSPTTRPVRYDLFIEDDSTGERRLKTCKEHYWDMVSELWFSLKHVVHAEQMRELDMETVREGSLRETGMWSKKRAFVESKHNPKDRKKMVRSPDLVDNLVALVEGARRLGFKIQNLSESASPLVEKNDWANEASAEFSKTLRKHLLTHA
jgi:hypothetical protein